jgi:cytochrome c
MGLRRRFTVSADAVRWRLPLVGTSAVLLACLGAGESQAAGDAVKGRAAFIRQCAICHTIDKDGPNRLGPNLFGIVGRKAGTAPGFEYSRAFKATASFDWTEGLLGPWISLPSVMVPGTTMGVFQGVAERDRDDIVAYLAAQR